MRRFGAVLSGAAIMAIILIVMASILTVEGKATDTTTNDTSCCATACCGNDAAVDKCAGKCVCADTMYEVDGGKKKCCASMTAKDTIQSDDHQKTAVNATSCGAKKKAAGSCCNKL